MILLAGALALTIIVIVSLGYFAEKLAYYIPYSFESKAASSFDLSIIEKEKSDNPPAIEVENYLQKLANRLSVAQQLPDGMNITVHYVESETINAFATLGGHIVFFRGLLEKIPDENALAMVMGHEIAHIKHRHPIASMGRSVVISLAIAAVAGSTDNDTLGKILGNTGLLTALSFTREQEREADNTAIASIARLYGHTGGSKSLFEIFRSDEKKNNINVPEFFSSHPVTTDRISNIDAIAKKNSWKTMGEHTKLPYGFQPWLESTKDKSTP